MHMRRAKIVCTIGPATESLENVQALVDAGMDVARLNRSHGDHKVHEEVYRNVRTAAEASGRAVAVLVDLQGPKIRLGRFINGEETDRKSTRLNSSHVAKSYAVFCVKKTKKLQI